MPHAPHIRALQKFDSGDLEMLRDQLLEVSGDYRCASELLQVFLGGRGYGLSPEAARQMAMELGASRCSIEALRQALNAAAMMS